MIEITTNRCAYLSAELQISWPLLWSSWSGRAQIRGTRGASENSAEGILSMILI